jgi:hypothetical protein
MNTWRDNVLTFWPNLFLIEACFYTLRHDCKFILTFKSFLGLALGWLSFWYHYAGHWTAFHFPILFSPYLRALIYFLIWWGYFSTFNCLHKNVRFKKSKNVLVDVVWNWFFCSQTFNNVVWGVETSFRPFLFHSLRNGNFLL